MAQTTVSPLMSGLLFAARETALSQSPDDYLSSVLARESVLTGLLSPVHVACEVLRPAIDAWSNGYVTDVLPSGSFAKGTAIRSGTDLDLFLSIRSDVPNTVKEAYQFLANQLRLRGMSPKLQNVSVGVMANGLSVDLVPARQQNPFCDDHTIYHRRTDSWRKTNILKHISFVRSSGRQSEIRALKLWRNQKGLEFPSFYLELVVIRALQGSGANLSSNLATALDFLATQFESARIVDPANTANIISEDLTIAEKARIRIEAKRALVGPWTSFIR